MAKNYGKTKSGVPITDELVAELAEKAEAGYDVDEVLRRRGGRPAMGSAPASVESVRLEPELREALVERAPSRPRDDVVGHPPCPARVSRRQLIACS